MSSFPKSRELARRVIERRQAAALSRDQKLRASDIPACVGFNRDGLNWDEHDFAAWLTTDHVKGQVATNPAGQIVGFIIYKHCGCGALHIKNIAIDPAHRRRGHGRRLLTDVYFRERFRPLTADVCEVDEPAVGFFRSQGFDVFPLERETVERDGVLRDVWRFFFHPAPPKPLPADLVAFFSS